MVRVSNCIVGFLNCCSLLVGLIAIAAALFFYIHGGSHCQTTLAKPLFVMGVVLSVVSLLGLTGTCCKVNSILLIYSVVLLLLIVGVLVFTIFCVLITNEDAGKTLSNKEIKGFKTWDFTNWLRNHFVEGKNWYEISSCLKDSDVCSNEHKGFHLWAADIFLMNLYPIQSGCCKPPSECGFKGQNATFWTAPETGQAANNSDCKRWSNQRQTLCYDCIECKAGFVANIKKGWRNLAIFNICVLVIVILTCIFSCCARRNNGRDKFRNRKYHP